MLQSVNPKMNPALVAPKEWAAVYTLFRQQLDILQKQAGDDANENVRQIAMGVEGGAAEKAKTQAVVIKGGDTVIPSINQIQNVV